MLVDIIRMESSKKNKEPQEEDYVNVIVSPSISMSNIKKQLTPKRNRQSTIVVSRKVILIGDSGIGKTSLLKRFATGNFDQKVQTTIGVDFHVHNMQIDNLNYKMHFWDTSGQEKFCSLTGSFYRSADAVMLIYDATDRKSFESCQKWFDEVMSYSDILSQRMMKGILIANKCETHKAVSDKEGKELALNFGLKYIETSAKDGTNVELAFNTLLECIHQNDKEVCREQVVSERLRKTSCIKVNKKNSDSDDDDNNGCCK
jgi:small GTP-binding protein